LLYLLYWYKSANHWAQKARLGGGSELSLQLEEEEEEEEAAPPPLSARACEPSEVRELRSTNRRMQRSIAEMAAGRERAEAAAAALAQVP
jgi:hypothetical protein